MIGDDGSKGVEADGRGEGVGRESRRSRVAPRLNDQIVLLVSKGIERRLAPVQNRDNCFVLLKVYRDDAHWL
jgi:hypothetical protein